MESPKLLYDKLKGVNDIENVAFTRLFENYLKYDLKGPNKVIEIEDTDQESVLKKISGGLPFQGMIYTFIHVNNQTLQEIQNIQSGKIVKFHDYTPILFCTSYNPTDNIVKGINLNILPPEERVKFFEAYYNVYKTFLKDVEELTQYNHIALNTEYRIAALSGKNPELFEYFNKSQHALFNYAYRSYNMLNLRKFRMMEYEDWQYIPFFNAKQSFKKANLEIIYKTYYDNKNKTK